MVYSIQHHRSSTIISILNKLKTLIKINDIVDQIVLPVRPLSTKMGALVLCMCSFSTSTCDFNFELSLCNKDGLLRA